MEERKITQMRTEAIYSDLSIASHLCFYSKSSTSKDSNARGKGLLGFRGAKLQVSGTGKEAGGRW